MERETMEKTSRNTSQKCKTAKRTTFKASGTRAPTARKMSGSCCAECGKRFRSEKALHGHMRTHPERSWRGMNPPTSPILLGLCPNCNEEEEDQQYSWDEHEAATCLLMLDDSAPLEMANPCSLTKDLFASHQGFCAYDNSEAEDRVVIVESVTTVHKCWICSKVFACGQALGGHMRCHRSSSVNTMRPFELEFGLNFTAARIKGNDSSGTRKKVDEGSSCSSGSGLDLRLAL